MCLRSLTIRLQGPAVAFGCFIFEVTRFSARFVFNKKTEGPPTLPERRSWTVLSYENRFYRKDDLGSDDGESLAAYGVEAPIDVQLTCGKEIVDVQIEEFAAAGASYITFHAEGTRNIDLILFWASLLLPRVQVPASVRFVVWKSTSVLGAAP